MFSTNVTTISAHTTGRQAGEAHTIKIIISHKHPHRSNHAINQGPHLNAHYRHWRNNRNVVYHVMSKQKYMFIMKRRISATITRLKLQTKTKYFGMNCSAADDEK